MVNKEIKAVRIAYENGFVDGYNKGANDFCGNNTSYHQKAHVSVCVWHNIEDKMPNNTGKYLVKMGSGTIMGCEYDEDYGQFGVWNEYFDPETMASLGRDWVELQDVEKWMDIPEGW